AGFGAGALHRAAPTGLIDIARWICSGSGARRAAPAQRHPPLSFVFAEVKRHDHDDPVAGRRLRDVRSRRAACGTPAPRRTVARRRAPERASRAVEARLAWALARRGDVLSKGGRSRLAIG